MLLRHFHTVYMHLFEYLAPQEIVVLLSTCHTLRHDSAASAGALQRDPTTRHSFQHCQRDWCKTIPKFDWEYGCHEATEHEDNPWKDDALLPVSKRVALLSLAGLMASQLENLLYSSRTGGVYSFDVVPFIFPITVAKETTVSDLCDALNAIRPKLGDTFFTDERVVSETGLHWENLTVDSETGNITCTFCESIDHVIAQYKEDGYAYWKNCEGKLQRLQQEWRNAGYDSSTDEFDDRTNAYKQSLHASDTLYNEQMLEETGSEVARHLMNEGRLPLLQLMAPTTEYVVQCVESAVAYGFREDLCPHVYRRLREFFDTNGFRHVRRAQPLKYKVAQGLRDEIHNVEVIGGLAPHGLFAGVYIVEFYT